MKTIKHIFYSFVLIMLFSTCKKGDLESTKNTLSKEVLQRVDDWLNSQIVNESFNNNKKTIISNSLPSKSVKSLDWITNFNISVSEQNSIIEFLKKNIESSQGKTEKKDNKFNFLILPINEKFKEVVKFEKNTTLSLILVIDKFGKINSGNILCFEPKDRIKRNGYQPFALPNIFNNKPIADDGTFKFYNVNGKFHYQFQFEKSKLISFAIIQPKEVNQKSKKIRSNNEFIGCIDWYLVTTYYLSDGTTEVVEVYLGRTCSNDDEGGGGGNGNDTPPKAEVPEINTVNITTQSSDFSNDEEGANFSDNQPTGGSVPTDYIRLKYTHTASVDYTTFAGFTIVDNVNPDPTTASPMSSPFRDSHGFIGTRTITLLGHNNYWQRLTPPFIRVTWNVDVHGRYINNAPNIYTKQWHHNHSQIF